MDNTDQHLTKRAYDYWKAGYGYFICNCLAEVAKEVEFDLFRQLKLEIATLINRRVTVEVYLDNPPKHEAKAFREYIWKTLAERYNVTL